MFNKLNKISTDSIRLITVPGVIRKALSFQIEIDALNKV